MDDLTGRQYGKYRLLRKIGAGTFGEVYLGEHVYLKTLTAIKILHSQLVGDEMESFLSEARTVARLKHTHIVRILDFDVEKGTPFLVMDFAPNGTLRERHPRGITLPLDMITTYVEQIANALQYAHDEKLIHRDVKPDNMLLGQRGEILLSDFGIATIAHSTHSMRVQNVAGTALYMAPEQIQGKPRPASDQYALGVLVYQWLTGTSPFRGSYSEIVAQHLTTPPPPLQSIVPTIPVEIEQVVLTALSKDPKSRFGSVQAFANAFEQAYKVSAPSNAPPSQPSEPYPLLGNVPRESPSPRSRRIGQMVIGIDFGTTSSCVAVIEDGVPIVIPNAEGSSTTSSIVAIQKNGERLVGEVAKRQAVANPENTIYSIKRFMGRKYDDPEVDRDKRLASYKVVRASNGDAWVEVQGKQFSPPEISAMILQKLKTDAEAYLGERVTQAVIAVPTYFNDVQRQAMKVAGRIAGVEVLHIISGATAASLAYGLDKRKDKLIAVYDLGGGTFDISILELGDGVFEVKSTNGDPHLGGDDFDQRIINWLAEEFRRENGIDLRQDRMALPRLKEAAEKAKKELSSLLRTEINLPFITADASGPMHLTMTLSRSKLEQLVEGLIEKSRGPVMKAFADAGIRPGDIQEVVLVGGQTRMPAVQTLVRRIFDRDPHRGVNPDEVVAVGAAIQAGVLTGDVKDVLLLDVIPLSLGIETLGGVFTRLIERNTTIPRQKSQVFTTADSDQSWRTESILPPMTDNHANVEIKVLRGEHKFARDNRLLGIFVLSGISQISRGMPQIEITFDINANAFLNVSACDNISGCKQNIIIDVSRDISKGKRDRKVINTLGIETQDGVFIPLIERNAAIPVKKSRIFPTSEREALRLLPTLVPPMSTNQISVEINVFQGEREFAKDNRSLGSFILDGIPPAPRGIPQIEVTFDIDANGNVNVSARDKGTGREQKITIVASSGLSKEQIDRMVRDAEVHAAEAKRRKEEVEERNQADSAAYQSEKNIAELGDKITPEQKSELESRVADVRAALATDDVARIKESREALMQAFHKVSEEIYRQRARKGDFNDGT